MVWAWKELSPICWSYALTGPGRKIRSVPDADDWARARDNSWAKLVVAVLVVFGSNVLPFYVVAGSTGGSGRNACGMRIFDFFDTSEK